MDIPREIKLGGTRWYAINADMAIDAGRGYCKLRLMLTAPLRSVLTNAEITALLSGKSLPNPEAASKDSIPVIRRFDLEGL